MQEISIINSIVTGLSVVFTMQGLCMVTLGVCVGIMIGAIPGMSPAMGVALLVPFSFGMDPTLAFLLFVAAYQAANYGGSITAIAINAPGTPASVVTAIDGHALTKKGRPGEALGTAVFSSAIGGLIGGVVLVCFSYAIADFALNFGPAEYFSLAVFGLTTVVALGGQGVSRTLIAVLLGLLLNTVRLDPFTGDPRFSVGLVELYDGFSFIPAMIGLFALAEIFYQIEKSRHKMEVELDSFSGELPALSEMWSLRKHLAKSSIVGTLIGVIPGAGATIASFISYAEAKRTSPRADQFGEGVKDGIVASEAANSSSVGGALIPLLALGIPGSATDAVLLGALSLHGLVAGPELFSTNYNLICGIFVCVILANIFILCFGLLGNKIWLSIIKIPAGSLYPLIIAMCFLGSYSFKNSMFDVWGLFSIWCAGLGAKTL